MSDYSELNLFRRVTRDYFVEYETDCCLNVPDISDKVSSSPFRLLSNATSNNHGPFGTRVARVSMFYQTVIFGHLNHRSDPAGKVNGEGTALFRIPRLEYRLQPGFWVAKVSTGVTSGHSFVR